MSNQTLSNTDKNHNQNLTAQKSIFDGLGRLDKPNSTPQEQIEAFPTKSVLPHYKSSETSFHGTEFILGFILAFLAMAASKKMFKN
jgi:hypothetical protein